MNTGYLPLMKAIDVKPTPKRASLSKHASLEVCSGKGERGGRPDGRVRKAVVCNSGKPELKAVFLLTFQV